MKYTDPKQTVVYDTECYPNYWSIAFMDVATGKERRFERTPEQELDCKNVVAFMRRTRLVSFNGNGYDIPMTLLALSGADNRRLKHASDQIIVSGVRSWQFLDLHGLRIPSYLDHIDLMEVSPGSPQKPSLKMYAGRLHSHTMRDLPFDPDRVLSADDIEQLREYHTNDLNVTRELFGELAAQCAIRAAMSDQYGLDLRSKSDAQIAEAVIKAEVEKALGRRLEKPEIIAHTFKYNPPAFLKFRTKVMQDVFNTVCEADFVVDFNGKVLMPDVLSKLSVQFAPGTSIYRMGIGGLHSSESSVSHYSDDEHMLIDRDVTSYYPNIILGTGLFPRHMGQYFALVYRSIYERRIAAKKSGDNNVAETLKIVLNGSFGKFGSPYSILYAPDLMIQTTIGGQLMILMLIESLFLDGFNVVSANTDGFVTKVPRRRLDEFNAKIAAWESATGLNTEETQYKALHSRDVNSYVAIGINGKVKLKGAFTPSGRGQKGAAGLKKNPNCDICTQAVVAYLNRGVPLAETVRQCDDIRKFVTVRRVTGGAMKDGELVGKVVRLYYAKGESGCLTYKLNGNTVPKSEGAKPLMELPPTVPSDIDYEWYEREATAILQEVGLPQLDPAIAHRSGFMVAKMPEQVTGHVVELPKGVALCGKRMATVRDRWQECEADSVKVCPTCRRTAPIFGVDFV